MGTVLCVWLAAARFERAFGMLPGILLAGITMGAYHLGTFGLSGVLIMAAFGISFGAVFRVTRNLLSMWSLTWAICASIGTVSGGHLFSLVRGLHLCRDTGHPTRGYYCHRDADAETP